MNWLQISKEKNLSVSFLQEHEDELDWKAIAYSITLNKEIIESFQDKWVWTILLQNSSFSVELVEEMKDSPSMDWNHFSTYYPITIDVFMKFVDYIDIHHLYRNKKTTVEILEARLMEEDNSDSESQVIVRDTEEGNMYCINKIIKE